MFIDTGVVNLIYFFQNIVRQFTKTVIDLNRAKFEIVASLYRILPDCDRVCPHFCLLFFISQAKILNRTIIQILLDELSIINIRIIRIQHSYISINLRSRSSGCFAPAVTKDQSYYLM